MRVWHGLHCICYYCTSLSSFAFSCKIYTGGCRWCEEHCPGADHVLKTDDDQFVDTLQLPRFLTTFLPQTDRKWFLCHVLDNDPQRHVSSKWFVTREEWPRDTYPQYCAGWAYVTTPATVKQVRKLNNHDLSQSKVMFKTKSIPDFDPPFCHHHRKSMKSFFSDFEMVSETSLLLD